MEDLEMTTYLNDTSAGAVVPGDFGISRFHYMVDIGFMLFFKRHLRIKILEQLHWIRQVSQFLYIRTTEEMPRIPALYRLLLMLLKTGRL